jgi:hypothetical protein
LVEPSVVKTSYGGLPLFAEAAIKGSWLLHARKEFKGIFAALNAAVFQLQIESIIILKSLHKID